MVAKTSSVLQFTLIGDNSSPKPYVVIDCLRGTIISQIPSKISGAVIETIKILILIMIILILIIVMDGVVLLVAYLW